MLAAQVDEIRRFVSPTLEAERRSALGQFMTPASIASFMASNFDDLPDHIRLLDAGAGMGALTTAFVMEACSRSKRPSSINVTAYEIDEKLAAILEQTLLSCVDICAKADIQFTYNIIQDDYILCSAEPLLDKSRTYNCAILNPPYGKINSTSPWRIALRLQGIETVNLYTAFTALAIKQMEAGGELVAITPRSFCNGSYYEPFRRLMLDSTSLISLHLFESRRTAFKDDDVLQENIIFKIRKGCKQNRVKLSSDMVEAREVSFSDIVRPKDKHVYIRFPIEDSNLANCIQGLPCTLADLGIKVSTGRVVDFRAKEHLRKMPKEDTVPLIYPAHFDNGKIREAIPNFKKYNALADNEDTLSLIVPAGFYVLTKRFSAKEEKRRLVAAVYKGGRVGFENHLNYFHSNGEGLSLKLADGLCAFLNSEAVDQYFRIFSGHTQVNAMDLRNLHYPTVEQLEELADAEDIDEAVEALF
jgi:adenine-specific DNA-methyltransferase